MDQPAGFFMLSFYLNTIETFLISNLYLPFLFFCKNHAKIPKNPQKSQKI